MEFDFAFRHAVRERTRMLRAEAALKPFLSKLTARIEALDRAETQERQSRGLLHSKKKMGSLEGSPSREHQKGQG